MPADCLKRRTDMSQYENETGRTTEQEKKSKKEKPKKTMAQEILSWVLTIGGAVIIAMLIRFVLFEPIRVDGESMTNTLQNNEIVLATKPEYLLGSPKRGDIVICNYPNRKSKVFFGLIETDTMFVKRLIGLPGDTIEIHSGVVYINGEMVEELNEPAIDVNVHDHYTEMAAYTLGEDEYFVMGDNRGNSNDSRRVGPISRSMIKGHVSFSVWPLSTFGTVK